MIRVATAALILQATGPVTAEGAGWDPQFAASAGLNGEVTALASSGTDLYVAGTFTSAGGLTVNHIAKWDGSTWSTLGAGTDGTVLAIAVSGSDVYVGGSFTTAGNAAASRVAKWDGSSWSTLGAGVSGGGGVTVRALAVSGTDVYVAGSFAMAGTTAVANIAKWDGSTWSGLGSGLNSMVNGLAVSGSEVYAAGSFITAGGSAAKGTARWDGSTWSSLGGAATVNAKTIAAVGSGIYAGFGIQAPSPDRANGIARLNGGAWSPLGLGFANGVYATVSAIAEGGGNLYVGGGIARAGGVPAQGVARWTGSTWLPLGEGTSGGGVAGIAVLGADVYVGGTFLSAGGVSSPYIGRWSGSEAVCGDGVVTDPDEECDDANATGGDGCSAACQSECPLGYTGKWKLSSGPFLAVDTMHVIDDGNGLLRGALAATTGLGTELVGQATGRDVYVRFPALDSSSPVPNATALYRRGCDALYVVGSLSAEPNIFWQRVSTSACGDGTVDSGEECDLGVLNENEHCGDGQIETCSVTCRILGSASAIVCDDGNLVDGDGCDSNCRATGCGNGVATSGEGCDDGNLVADDGCNQNCQVTQCGDGVLSPGEAGFCRSDLGEVCSDTCNLNWLNPFGDVPFADLSVEAIMVEGEDYYVAGFNSTWRWRNGGWTSMGRGLWYGENDSTVLALARFGSKIYAGGYDLSDGRTGAPLHGIASWDGSSWSEVGGGVRDGENEGAVSGLLSHDGKLYVAGYFDQAGGAAANGIATWDGASWATLGDGLRRNGGTERGVGTALATMGGDLYVGGSFTMAGGSEASNIAKWDGSGWSSLGEGLPIGVVALATDGTNLYAAGERIVRKWDGAVWTSLLEPGEFTGQLRSLAVVDGNLYVAGTEFAIGRINGVARWDGSRWSPLGKGIGGRYPGDRFEVLTLSAVGDRLLVGGNFRKAGGQAMTNLAIWNETGCGEACDDGNQIDGDGCDSNCEATACGNGIRTGEEACDDGNAVDGDGCDSNCTETACGNGVWTMGETCDDGNAVDGDGCETDCRLSPIAQSVPAGGTVTTPPASEEFPIQTAVTVPTSGTVTIAEAPDTTGASGFQVLGRVLEITAPAASASQPIRLVILVRDSAIPPGYAPADIGVSRDGVAIADCTGAAGQASPDPCIESRTSQPGYVDISVLTSHASAWAALARGLDDSELSCVLGATRSAVAVAATQLKGGAKCLKAAEVGKSDLEECLASGAGAKSGKAMQKTSVAAAACPEGVPFAFAGATQANLAALGAAQRLLVGVLGTDMTAALDANPSAAPCRKAMLGGLGKLLSAKVSAFVNCEQAGLANEAHPFVSAAELAGCLQEVPLDPSGAAGKALAVLAKGVGVSCQPASRVPGACSGSSDVAGCINDLVDCQACRMLAGVAGLSANCDEFDDGLVNRSCD